MSSTLLLSVSSRAIIASMMRLSAGLARDPRSQHLQRPLHAGQRISHFVRHHRGQLAELRQRRLIGELLFHRFPLA